MDRDDQSKKPHLPIVVVTKRALEEKSKIRFNESMCQLLAMSCNVPTDICFSFTGFRNRGGLTDEHKDGWGIAFFEGKGVRQFLDSESSVRSPVAEFVRNYPIKSQNVISHIRKATLGRVALENTHPFLREMWGSYWIFAHNGTLKNFEPALDGEFRPVGETDSERAFCFLLHELRKEFGSQPPPSAALFGTLTRLAKDLGARGVFNFLLSNGDALFAHCSTRLAYILRQAPFSTATLKDHEMKVDFSTLASDNDRVAVIATTPLTDEAWTIIEPGTLLCLKDGAIVEKAETVLPPKEAGVG